MIGISIMVTFSGFILFSRGLFYLFIYAKHFIPNKIRNKKLIAISLSVVGDQGREFLMARPAPS